MNSLRYYIYVHRSIHKKDSSNISLNNNNEVTMQCILLSVPLCALNVYIFVCRYKYTSILHVIKVTVCFGAFFPLRLRISRIRYTCIHFKFIIYIIYMPTRGLNMVSCHYSGAIYSSLIATCIARLYTNNILAHSRRESLSFSLLEMKQC